MIGIDNLIATARLEGRTDDLEILKMLKAELLKEQVSETRKLPATVKRSETPLTHDEQQAVLRRMIKARRASVDAYSSAGRQELADKEASEIKFLETYLDQEPNIDDVIKTLEAWITETSGVPKEFGPRMGLAKKAFPEVPPRLLSQALKELTR
jgi:uncharacterized protein YqeY